MALYRRPSNMPRFSRGRMFNRRTGGYAPSLYSGFRPRRAMHMRFQTQTSPYGAGGGRRRQYHAAHSGHAGNVYGAMLHHARRQGGVNMGLLTAPNRTRSSRQLGHYRQGLSKAGRDAYTNFMGGRTRSDFDSASKFRAARRQARKERRQARRGFAGSYRNPYTGSSDRRVTTMSYQNPYTGVRNRVATRFTTPFTEGMRNRMKRRTKLYQAAKDRYEFGRKNPTMQTPIPFLPGGNKKVPLRSLSLGGYRYMSPRFHARLGQAKRGGQTLSQIGTIAGTLGSNLGGLWQKINRERAKTRERWSRQVIDQGRFGQFPGAFPGISFRGRDPRSWSAFKQRYQRNQNKRRKVDRNQYNLNRGLGRQNIA